MNDKLSYLYGLFITDGYWKNKEHRYLGIELGEDDEQFLRKLMENIPKSKIYKRERNTNFKQNYLSFSLNIYDTFLGETFIEYGFPLESKTENAAPPKGKYSEKDFWRGVIDGDGSLGIRKAGLYLNLTTKSEELKNGFVALVKKITGFEMNVHRNVRDNVYNLTICQENARQVASYLYENSDKVFRLPRKYEKYLEFSTIPVKEHKASKARRRWTKEEEEILRTHNYQEACELLDRTKVAIRKKRYKMGVYT